MDKPPETQEQVRQSKVTARILYGCALAYRMRAISVRPEYAKIVMMRNGFTDGEAQECIDQAKARWDKLTPKEQRERRMAVERKQFLKDLKR